jgi:hypothetical protein
MRLRCSRAPAVAARATARWSSSSCSGIGPQRYVMQRRVQRAKTLMSRTNHPLAWVAQEAAALDGNAGPSSHLTRRWSKADSNSESHPRATPPAATRFVADSAGGSRIRTVGPRHVSVIAAPCHSTSNGVRGTGSVALADRAFSCSAAHSMQPGAHTVLTGGGLRRSSSS